MRIDPEFFWYSEKNCDFKILVVLNMYIFLYDQINKMLKRCSIILNKVSLIQIG